MFRMFLVPLLCCVALSGSVATADESQPNFVVVLVDDLGWTDLGCYGSDLYRTPHIDRLAKEGVRFTDAYAACTVCSPTRAALLTGKYPARLRVTDWIHGHYRKNAKLNIPDWTHFLPLEEVTLAEALGDAGYATCHVGKWHLGDEGRTPTDQGFDHNVGGTDKGQPPSYFSPYRIPTLEDGPQGEYLTDREAAEACRFIETNKDRPFFLYLAHYAVHTPIQAKRELTEKFQREIRPEAKHRDAKYAAMIESVDDALGKVREQLAESGVANRTVIVFTSDNGGLSTGAAPTDNSPLRAGKGSTYEGGVRVPFIAYWPGVTPRGATCDEPVISNDVYPTLLEIAQAPGDARHNADVDGESLVALLKDPAAPLDREAIYWHYPHYHPGGATPYSAIRARDWKLIEFFEDGRVELYHLAEDIGEKRDLSPRMPDKAADLRATLQNWRESVRAQLPTQAPARPTRR